MRFGNLKFDGDNIFGDPTSKRMVNIGDAAELLAIDHLYRSMGIDEIDIVDYSKLLRKEQAVDDYTLLPINLAVVPDGLSYHILHFPEKIIPVYIAISLINTNLSNEQIEYMKKFEPIGCRDERTLNYLRGHKVEAYLYGCIVSTFPKVETLEGKESIFFVDVPASIKNYIPKKYYPHIKFANHEYFCTPEQWGEDSGRMRAATLIKTYQEQSRLIVTSRFHGAVLGLALGIPTIVTLENNNFKWSWVSKYLPVYTPEQFCRIDWNGTVPDYEPVKSRLLQVAEKRIRSTYDKYNEIYTLSQLQENSERDDEPNLLYYKGFIQYCAEHLDKSLAFFYILWGLNANAEKIYQYMSKEFPFAKLEYVYDYYKYSTQFHGVKSICPTPEVCMAHKDIFTIVTSNSAKYMAREFFQKAGKENFYLCTLDFLTPDDLDFLEGERS